jgi:hypothetical protein
MSRRQEHVSREIEDCEREAVGCDGLFQNECDGELQAAGRERKWPRRTVQLQG